MEQRDRSCVLDPTNKHRKKWHKCKLDTLHVKNPFHHVRLKNIKISSTIPMTPSKNLGSDCVANANFTSRIKSIFELSIDLWPRVSKIALRLQIVVQNNQCWLGFSFYGCLQAFFECLEACFTRTKSTYLRRDSINGIILFSEWNKNNLSVKKWK